MVWARRVVSLILIVLVSHAGVLAQTAAQNLTLVDWLRRVHEATRQNAYTGTFVVSSGSGVASAKIWHVGDGAQQMERVVSLSGISRVTYRHNDRVITFFPASGRAVVEHRESLGLLPDFLNAADSSIGKLYQFSTHNVERIAGLEADVVHLVPMDRLRYGWKVWSERKTGVVLQLQTLDLDGKVLEQSAFSELKLDAPVTMRQLSHLMEQTEGYRLESPEKVKVNAEMQGWVLNKGVHGFREMGCYQRSVRERAESSSKNGHAMQWVFSDGLASVSLFVEPYDARRHVREGGRSLGGATHSLAHRIDGWWATAVGEVPVSTLKVFVQGLERTR